MKILITGGAGFFGHHLVEHLLKNTDWEIVVWDKLTYASNGYDRLRDIKVFDDRRVNVLGVDFTSEISPGIVKETGKVDYIVHAGAETHVDNSISDPKTFLETNIMGTHYMLEYAKQVEPKRFVYFSTDEVFGPAPNDDYKEGDRHNPGNPYAASKAAAEDIAVAYANTYKIPVQITNTMNLFGERQHPEKFIPICINKILNDETVTIHANEDKTKAGSRYYLHCRNAADALLHILENTDDLVDSDNADSGKYNIVGNEEVSNLEMAQTIAEILGKKLKYEMVDFHSSRPGHDLRYGLDGSKLKRAGFEFDYNFKESLKKTIDWSLENDKWLKLTKFSNEV